MLQFSAGSINRFTLHLQDPEKGLAGGLSTEEAIHVLAKSYDSSKICHQVQKEIAQTKKRVSLATPLEGRKRDKIEEKSC